MSELTEILAKISLEDENIENKNKAEDMHFMAICQLSAQRSKDPCTQVGACIVNKNGNLMGTGYNGMPRGCEDDDFPWGKRPQNPLKNKHLYVCHAELNAITNTIGDINDCTLYVTLFPCNECAKLIIQNGISEVVYLSDKHREKTATIASKLMFNSAGIKYRQFKANKKRICIDFLENRVI